MPIIDIATEPSANSDGDVEWRMSDGADPIHCRVLFATLLEIEPGFDGNPLQRFGRHREPLSAIASAKFDAGVIDSEAGEVVIYAADLGLYVYPGRRSQQHGWEFSMIRPMSDKGLSVLVFAAYHALSSGGVVRELILDDGKGHKADPGGVAEMKAAGLLQVDGERGRLTEAGERALADLIEACEICESKRTEA